MLRLYKYDNPYEYKDFENFLFTSLKPLFYHANDKVTVSGVEYRISTINYMGLFNRLVDNQPEYTLTLGKSDNSYAVFQHNGNFKVNINPKLSGCIIHLKIVKTTASDIIVTLPLNSFGTDIVNNQITLSGAIGETFILQAVYEGGEYDWIIRGRSTGFLGSNAAVAWGDITNKPATYPPDAHTHAQLHDQNTDYVIYSDKVSDIAIYIGGSSTGTTYYITPGTKINIAFDANYTSFVDTLQVVNTTVALQRFTNISIYENNILVYSGAITYQSINANYGPVYGYKLDYPVQFTSGKTYRLELSTDYDRFVGFNTTTQWVENGTSYNFAPNYTVQFTDNNGVSQNLIDKSIFNTLRFASTARVDTSGGDIKMSGKALLFNGSPLASINHTHDKLHTPDGQTQVAYTDNAGNFYVAGNIIQNGVAYETHAEQVFTTNDTIIMRDGAVSALPAGTVSGFRILKYDGTNNLFLGADVSGIVRVGDEGGQLQVLATREDAPINGGFAIWNASALRFDTVSPNTAFNKNFGTVAGTVAEGNHIHDSRYYTEIEVDNKLINKENLINHILTTEDLNTIIKSGMYRLGSNINSPVTYGQLLVIHGSSDTVTQIIGDFRNSDLYTRSGNPPEVGGAGSWKEWGKLWTNLNDGSGSGLDADLLDGYQSSVVSAANTVAVRDANKVITSGGYVANGIFKVYSGTSWKGSVGWDGLGVYLWNTVQDSGLKIYDSDGHATFGGTVTAVDFIPTSDKRLKQDIKDLDKGIEGLRPVSFKMKESGELFYGFIAQDMLTTHPELVQGTGKKLKSGEIDYYRIKSNSIIAILVKEVQELKEKLQKNGIK